MSDDPRLRHAGPPPPPRADRPDRVRIATRGSDLALWQATWIAGRLQDVGVASELIRITTQGDVDGRPFAQLGGAGFFVKSVQEAVLDGRAEMAVHSCKDLPSAATDGLEIAALPGRADPRDVLLVRPEAYARDARPSTGDATTDAPLLPLREGATVGTSAVRRRDQLLWHRPDLTVAELRGNVPTRIAKLHEGRYDAIVIAAAGLERLGLRPSGVQVVPLDPERFLPAPAQGALALEIRRDDAPLAAVATELHDLEAYPTLAAERGLMGLIQGGCQLSLGAYAQRDRDGRLSLRAWYRGHGVHVQHARAEEAALLAYDALGRPDPRTERTSSAAARGA
ncbi:MAG: hydroxymethylbilane synthase [Trueperaceae bacterium]